MHLPYDSTDQGTARYVAAKLAALAGRVGDPATIYRIRAIGTAVAGENAAMVTALAHDLADALPNLPADRGAIAVALAAVEACDWLAAPTRERRDAALGRLSDAIQKADDRTAAAA